MPRHCRIIRFIIFTRDNVAYARRMTIYQSLTLFSLLYLNFHRLEVVSRYRDPQLQVGENYSYLFNLRLVVENLQILMFKHSFHSQFDNDLPC